MQFGKGAGDWMQTSYLQIGNKIIRLEKLSQNEFIRILMHGQRLFNAQQIYIERETILGFLPKLSKKNISKWCLGEGRKVNFDFIQKSTIDPIGLNSFSI